MAVLKNTSPGLRGVLLRNGERLWIEPGETVEVAKAAVVGMPDGIAVDGKLPQLDHDKDGEPGGSEPNDPPALSGKNKAELLEIAAAEGVEIEEGAKNADIVSAIELAREAAASGE